jgi:hypothetical protein
MTNKLCFIVLLALSGCATTSHYQRPAHFSLPLAQTMEAEVRLTQHEMMVSHANSTVAGAAGLQVAASPSLAGAGFGAGAAVGLIGALVDVAIDAHRNGVAEDAVKPMREHLQGLDIDDLIAHSTDGLDKHLFAETITAQRLTTSEDEDGKQRRLKEGANILVLTPSYSVSYDGKTFTYVLFARVVDRGMTPNGFIASTPRYQQVFQYILAQDNLPNGAQWGTLSAEQWKTILSDAANETVAMLNYDITTTPNAARAHMTYGRMPVALDQTKGERSWVRTNFGVLLSVSSASLTAKDRS